MTNTGTIEVTDDSTLVLSGETVTNSVTVADVTTNGIIQVDATDLAHLSFATLDLEGSTINGGTLTISGLLDSTGDSIITGATITNTGIIDVTSGIGTISGTASFVNTGTVEANGAELDLVNTTVTNTNGTVEATGTNGVLNLQGATIAGGMVSTTASTDVIEATSGISVISGTSSFINNGTLETLGAELDLVNTTVTNNGSIIVDLTEGLSGTLNLQGATINGGTVSTAASTDVIEATSGTGTISGTSSFINNGTLETLGAELDLVNTTVTNNGSIIVDLTEGLSGTLNPQGATINGGTVSTAASTDVIEATSGTSVISGTTSFVNAGTVEANDAELDLVNTTITNTNGTVEAIGTGVLDLENATVNGGTLGGTGTIATATGNTDSTLNGVTIAAGALVAAAAGTLDLTGTITNKGEIDAAPGGTLDLENAIVDGGTLGGSGTIATATGNTDSTLNGVTIAPATLVAAAVGTLDLTGTITNKGEIGAALGGTLDLENATVNGGTLGGTGTIATATGNTDSTLNGVTIAPATLVAAAVGTLDLTGTITNKGEIDAALGGTLDLENATINGGTLGGSGTIATATGNTDSTLNGVTIASGSKVVAAVGTLDLTGTITNKGEIDAALGGTLDLENATVNGGTLGGTGTIATAIGNTDSTLNGVTIAAGALVAAAVGTLDLTGTITNNGEIDATTGTLDLENAIINGGTLGGTGTIATATGNTDSTLNGVTIASGSKVTAAVGTLDLTGTITNKGEIDATTGGIDLESVTVNGGTLGGPGTIATVSGADTLNGVAIASGTTVQVTDNTALDLKGTISNGGTIALNSSGDTTQLEISGDVSLNGSGHVTLTDDTQNAIVSDGLAAQLTNSDTISGAGKIGDTLLTLVNDGTIDATGTHPLTIDTGMNNTATSAGPVGSLTVTNNPGGILENSAGHTLQIEDNVLNNGVIEAYSSVGSSIGVVVTGNITNITGTGSIELFNSAKLEIGGSVSSGQTVTFGAQGGPVATAATLILDDSHHFGGTIVGLTENSSESLENHVDLKDLAFRAGHMNVSIVSGSLADGIFEVSNGTDNGIVDLHLSGVSSGTFEFAKDATGGTLLDDPPASGPVTIDSGQTLDISAASTATVTFTNSNGNTGELVLDNSKAFTGQIAGFAGDGTISNSDLIDLGDVNFADVATNKTTYTDNGNGTGTLTLHDANGQALDSITFAGSYQLANFTIENDGSGNTLIHDPPVSTSPAVSGVVMHDPGPAASSSIVASAPDQTLTGFAASDNFVFNFAGIGHATVTDFHPDSDTLQFKSPVFASALAAFNAALDDGHGNTVIAIDAHDTITLSGVHKAQLHASDFHVV